MRATRALTHPIRLHGRPHQTASYTLTHPSSIASPLSEPFQALSHPIALAGHTLPTPYQFYRGSSMTKPIEIVIRANGFPSSSLDILCIYSALATVAGHRFQDNRLATNVILEDVFTELYAKNTSKPITYRIGSFTFLFTKSPDTPTDTPTETPSTSVL